MRSGELVPAISIRPGKVQPWRITAASPQTARKLAWMPGSFTHRRLPLKDQRLVENGPCIWQAQRIRGSSLFSRSGVNPPLGYSVYGKSSTKFGKAASCSGHRPLARRPTQKTVAFREVRAGGSSGSWQYQKWHRTNVKKISAYIMLTPLKPPRFEHRDGLDFGVGPFTHNWHRLSGHASHVTLPDLCFQAPKEQGCGNGKGTRRCSHE